MAYIGENPKAKWLNLRPQNADPTTPEEGDLFYSDGTPRAEGVWVYKNGSFEQLGQAATAESSGLINLGLACSVAANALTISLKDQSGNTPTGGSPVTVSFPSTSLTTGTFTQKVISSALSITVPAGANLGIFAGDSTQILYVYIVDTGASTILAASPAWLGESGKSATLVFGANAAFLYSATAQATSPFRLIGKLTCGTDGSSNWVTAPSRVELSPVKRKMVGIDYTATGAITIPTSFTTLIYNNRVYSTSNSYQSGGFIPPESGFYDITASICTSGATVLATSEQIEIQVEVNGVEIARNDVAGVGTALRQSVEVNVKVFLDIIVPVIIKIKTTGSINTLTNNAPFNRLCIAKISD